MWNEFLDEAKSARKYDNTPVIVLGNKHSGKRSLVDSLVEISKTTLYNKRMPTHLESNKMRLKGLAPVIDYAYLNVLDLSDPDYRTFVVT
jgi:dynein light intermediate chain 1